MADMQEIDEQLTELENTKQSIKEAIIEKGQEISDSEPFSSYADKILDINGEGDVLLVNSPSELPKTSDADKLALLASSDLTTYYNVYKYQNDRWNMLDKQNSTLPAITLPNNRIVTVDWLNVASALWASTSAAQSSQKVNTDASDNGHCSLRLFENDTHFIGLRIASRRG